MKKIEDLRNKIYDIKIEKFDGRLTDLKLIIDEKELRLRLSNVFIKDLYEKVFIN